MAEPEATLEFDVDTPEIEVTHNRLKYTCDDRGLRRDGHSFHAGLSEYLPILFKNGKINKGKSQGQKLESVHWWRAQCAFRGLPTSGSIGEVQERLRSGPTTMIEGLVELERKAKAEWKVNEDLNQWRARQKYQDQQRKDEQNGVVRLRALFNNNSDNKNRSNTTMAFLFKKDCQGLGHAAKKLDLQFRWIRSPSVPWNLEWDNHWIIVGRTVADVEAKYAELRQEEEDRVLAREIEEKEKEKVARDAETKLGALVADQSAKGGNWDVTGEWKIRCPEFYDEDYENNNKVNLRIYRADGTKVSQMFAKFDFGAVKGWLRFEDPATQDLPDVSVGQKRKQRAWDAFLIPLGIKPSPEYPTWNYRWRGRADGGEGYIEHYSDEYQCSMTFSGKGGCTLSGTFKSDFLECEFEGMKLGMVNPAEASKIAIDDQWACLYDSQYLESPR